VPSSTTGVDQRGDLKTPVLGLPGTGRREIREALGAIRSISWGKISKSSHCWRLSLPTQAAGDPPGKTPGRKVVVGEWRLPRLLDRSRVPAGHYKRTDRRNCFNHRHCMGRAGHH